jgi:type IV pilus assembly protein PilB
MIAPEPRPTPGHSLRRDKRLGELLLEAKLITPEQLDWGLNEQRLQRLPLGEILRAAGLVEERALAAILSVHFNAPLIDVTQQRPDQALLDILPESYAREHQVLPIRLEKDSLVVALADPGDLALLAELKMVTRKTIKPVLALRSDLEQAITQAYRMRGSVQKHLRSFQETQQTISPLAGGKRLAEVSADAPVVQIVDQLLGQGLEERASDIHIEPQATRLRIRFRIDGVLHDVATFPATLAGPITSRIKILANLDIVDRLRAQDGQIQARLGDQAFDVRVATSPTIWGEKVVLRLLDRSRSILHLPELGFSASTQRDFERTIRSPFGMLLVTGPTGSGKTTTLYAGLNELDRGERNIMTIEDPVEYTFDNINQIQINKQAGTTFASGLRAILRQDPDVILVGEIRDRETAEIAVQSALTGHLVLSSLHATDAVGALHRLLEMGVEPFLVASSVIGVVAQRLVRKNCPHCVLPYVPSPDELAYYRELGGTGEQFLRGAGCKRCTQTGFHDRIGIFEFVRITDAVKRLLVQRAGAEELRAEVERSGVVTLRQAGLEKIDHGESSIAEIMRSIYVL